LAVPPGIANHRTNRRVRILRWSKERLVKGIESRQVAGVTVRITTPAKTIVDCFRCPRQISREVALEALREGLANGITPADIAAVAQREHVLSIRPILEALT
jgi:predicted transcriptional regulator of viral defense system